MADEISRTDLDAAANDLITTINLFEAEGSNELVKTSTITVLQKKTELGKAYLAGYEVGYIDGKNGVPRDPIKEEEKPYFSVEPMRISLPWWP